MVRKIYLLNSPILPIKDNTECEVLACRTKNIDLVKEMIKGYIERGYGMISAIGHESTAKALSKLLELEVNVNRITVTLEQNDFAFAFSFEVRLPEGKVLTDRELEAMIKEGKLIVTIIKIRECWEIAP